MLKRQMLPSYLCTFHKLLADSWQIKIANMYRNIHASKRQKPTAQGNTLGKHPYVGLRPVRAKALHIKALRMLLSLQDVPHRSTLPGVLPRAVRYCPCGAYTTWNIKRTSQFIMLISNATFIAIQIYYTNIKHTVHLNSNL